MTRFHSFTKGIYFGLPGVLEIVASPAKSQVVRFGTYEFEPRAKELYRGGLRVRLEGQPIAILKMLVDRPGELVTREELQKELWPADTFVDFEHSLNAAVKRLRTALNDSADHPRYIETLARRGYRFIAPVNGTDAGGEGYALIATPSAAQAPAGFHGRRLWLKAFLALFAVAVIGWSWRQWRHREATASAPVIRSLAVLPLQNLSGDPSQEYFADGMTEELIGRLSKIHGLRVISRTSAMHFKNTQLSMAEIAKTLGVDAMVEGSVIREGNQIRVHAQLIRAATDEHIWAEEYQREYRSVLAIQDEVARSIAAHQTLGWAYLNKGKQGEAIKEFQQALQLSGTDDMDLELDLGFAYATAGKPEEARRILAKFKKLHERGLVPSGSIAILYGALGEFNEAFTWLEKAYEERDPQLTYLKVPGRRFEPLRHDPRFRQLVHRIGLPE